MKNRILYILIGVFVNTPFCFSVQNDSLCIETLLHNAEEKVFQTNSERLMFFANSFLGRPYKGGTLDTDGENETLIIRTDSFDCTTYVETVLALYLSSLQKNSGYKNYADMLRMIRYRNGIIKGYASRLHYFSDWAKDNERKGFIHEVTNASRHSVRVLSLNYMTEHAELYRQLKDNDSLKYELQILEKEWNDYKMPYIPKSCICSPMSGIIKDGDILALTTSIPGLDVVHLGFAKWLKGSLHLIHASSLYGEVVIDSLSLSDYLKGRKKHTGIRVFRVN